LALQGTLLRQESGTGRELPLASSHGQGPNAHAVAPDRDHGNGVPALLQHPEQRQRLLDDPGLAGKGRAEGKIVLRSLLGRFPRLRLTDHASLRWRDSMVVHGLGRFPVELQLEA